MSRNPGTHLAFPSTSASGISRNADGDRVVASSFRPDGSVRKERKIRPGFTPTEDIARYRPPGALAARGAGPIPGTAGGHGGRAVPGLGRAVQAALAGAAEGATPRAAAAGGVGPRAKAAASSKAQPQAVKPVAPPVALGAAGAAARRGAAKGKTPAREDEVKDNWDASSGDEADDAVETPAVAAAGPAAAEISLAAARASGPEDAEKKARAIKKKLRQAEQLQSRTDKPLMPDEQGKVDRIRDLEDELAKLSV
ncbi:mago-binding domain-containing protein [Rhodotorula paludigena]|uniref:mago-binding domain-containing protein n=1 Tax=Rhodotorula paludigena TaxID=86838 RepID=UPI003174DBF0